MGFFDATKLSDNKYWNYRTVGLTAVLAGVIALITYAIAMASRPSGLPDTRTESEKQEAMQYERIIGGQIEDNYFSVEGVVKIGSERSQCTGILISDREVLTAAHCGNASDPDKGGMVMFGTAFIPSYTSWTQPENSWYVRSIIKATPHPDYNPTTQQADVMVLHLDSPVPDVYTPMRLAMATVQNGQKLNISGWGRADTAGMGANDLYYVSPNLKTIAVEAMKCQLRLDGRRIEETEQPRENELCTDELETDWFGNPYATNGSGQCQGDSGGPVWYRDWYGDIWAVGVTSWSAKNWKTFSDSNGCNGGPWANHSQRISSYLPWIQSQITSGASHGGGSVGETGGSNGGSGTPSVGGGSGGEGTGTGGSSGGGSSNGAGGGGGYSGWGYGGGGGYSGSHDGDSGGSLPVVPIAAAAGGAVLIVVILAAVVIVRKRRRRAKRAGPT